MSEEKKQEEATKEAEVKKDTPVTADAPKAEEKKEATVEKTASSSSVKDDKKKRAPRGKKGDKKRGRKRRRREEKEDDGFESKIIDLARVTRVMAGGKRMSFRACVLVADGKGKVGMGIKKGADVQLAVQKGTNYGKKHLINVPVVDGTIPHGVEARFKGAHVILKPAKDGTGIIAGGAVRIALEMAGVENVVAKMKGSKSKINNLAAVLQALESLRTAEEIKKMKS